MKRLIIILLICLSLFGCTANNFNLIAPKDMAEELQRQLSFEGELEALDKSLIEDFLYLEESMYSDAYMLMDTSKATSELILVINAKDEKSKKQLKSNIESYIQDTIAQYKDYVPSEVPKLENAKVFEKGLQLISVVCKDYSNVEAVINNINK